MVAVQPQQSVSSAQSASSAASSAISALSSTASLEQYLLRMREKVTRERNKAHHQLREDSLAEKRDLAAKRRIRWRMTKERIPQGAIVPTVDEPCCLCAGGRKLSPHVFPIPSLVPKLKLSLEWLLSNEMDILQLSQPHSHIFLTECIFLREDNFSIGLLDDCFVSGTSFSVARGSKDSLELHAPQSQDEMATNWKNTMKVKTTTRKAVTRFLRAAEKEYHNTLTYHNWMHAVDVAQYLNYILMETAAHQWLSEHQRLSLLFAAVCHDIGHNGLSNTYLEATKSELCSKWGEISTLENMHAALMWDMIRKTGIFRTGIDADTLEEMKRCSTQAILKTDLGYHQVLVEKAESLWKENPDMVAACRNGYLGNRHQGHSITVNGQEKVAEGFRKWEMPREGIDFWNLESQAACEFFLHAADISYNCRPFKIATTWAKKALDEFFILGDKEKKLGIPMGHFNDRTVIKLPNSQLDYITLMVQPMYMNLSLIWPGLEHGLNTSFSNMWKYERMYVEDENASNQYNPAKRQSILDNIRNQEKKWFLETVAVNKMMVNSG